MTSTDRPQVVRLGLIWHTDNAGNLGLGALTQGHMAVLARAAERAGVVLRYSLFQGVQPGVRYVHAASETIGLTNMELLLPTRFARRIKALDAILDIGEGDGFTTLYGPKRLARQLATKFLARAAGVPYVIAPQTIGPLNGRLVRLAAAAALAGATHLVVRDERSAAAAREVLPSLLPHTSADVAFAMSAASIILPPTPRIRVGLNVSGLLANSRSREYRITTGFDYLSVMKAIAARLLSDARYEVHLIGHVFSDDPVDDDGRVAARWAAESDGFVLAPRFGSPEEAKGYIGAMDLLIASRMHACIAALGTCTPVIAVSYSSKFEGLFSTLDYPWVVPHHGMDDAGALALVEAGLSDLSRMAQDATAAHDRAERLLLTYADLLAGWLETFRAAPSPRSRQ